jgi:hypothetical protein
MGPGAILFPFEVYGFIIDVYQSRGAFRIIQDIMVVFILSINVFYMYSLTSNYLLQASKSASVVDG